MITMFMVKIIRWIAYRINNYFKNRINQFVKYRNGCVKITKCYVTKKKTLR